MNNGGPVLAASTQRETAHLVILCEPGSYAEQHVDRVAADAERVFGRILHVLKIPGEVVLKPHRITILAVDGPGQNGHGQNGHTSSIVPASGTVSSDLVTDVITAAYGPAGLAAGAGEHMARIVLHRLTAAVPTDERQSDAQSGTGESQRFFVEGTARYLAHKAIHGGKSDPPELADSIITCVETARRRKWRLPLYEAIVRGPEAVEIPGLFLAMQEAFSAYLLERDGLGEFLRFVAGAYRDPNHSAEIIYGKPLELLEREWIVELRGEMGRKMVTLWEFMKRVYPYLKPYPWRQVECIALMLIGSIATQVTPYQIRNLVDLLGNATAKADPWGYGLEQLGWILIVMTVAGLANLLSIIRLVYVVNVLGQNIIRDLREKYIDQVNRLPQSYFSNTRTGDVMARFTSDVGRLADPLAKTCAYSVYYIILLVISVFGLIGLSWQLTLILFLIVPTYVAISRILGPPLQRVNRGRQERLAQVNSQLEEMVIAQPIIKVFNLQRYMRRRANPEIHEFRRVEIRGDFLRAVFEEASDIADLMSTRLVWLIGGILVLTAFDPAAAAVVGSITIGTVVGFNTLMGRFVLPVHRLANIYSAIAAAAAALRRLEEVLTAEPEHLETPVGGTDEPPAVTQSLSYEGVNFAYALQPTLQDVNISIPAGTSAAFVGPTGAGKTTLVNMIPRFFDPSSGSVKIDGRDIREFSLPALRTKIAVVSQENHLFHTTVRENIKMGRLGATDEEIVAAAKAACIHDFIMTLPAGYDTVVGERGSRFSGGQRQRLAIARALLRGAPILILDEATSALDAETEHEILEELAHVTGGKTVISITHRLALAMRSDVIYVLDKGHIVQHGTHAELLGQEGLYRKLFEDQNEALLESGFIPTAGMGANGHKSANGEAANGEAANGEVTHGEAKVPGGEQAATAAASV